MTGRYPSASTALPTSLAMVFTASKSLLEVAGKPASIISTSSLASCRAMLSLESGVEDANVVGVRDAIEDEIGAAVGGRCGCGSGV